MQKILSKRVLRDLRANFFRYLALFLLIVMGMFLVVALIGAAETVMQGVTKAYEENLGEDGQFGTFVPLTEEEINQIISKGVTLEANFNMDYQVGDTTVRVMKVREKVDLFDLTEGRLIEKDGEILLEQHYAAACGYSLGSRISLGSTEFTVVGTGSVPDYDAPFEKAGDTSVNSDQFGFSLVSAADYDSLREKAESFKTEEYLYSYRLNGAMTDEELKELVQSFELDRDKVTDVYFLEMLEELEETKNDIQEGIDELLDGSRELSDGLQEIADNNGDLVDAVDTLFDAMLEEANDSFRENEIEVTLQADTFEEQLDAMIASVSAYSKGTRDSRAELKETLQNLRKFRDGIYDYTDGAAAVEEGTLALHEGIGELVGSNGALQQGASSLTEAVMSVINQGLAQELAEPVAQLKQFGVLPTDFSVPTLTLENYESQLGVLLAADYGPADSAIRPALEAVKGQIDSLKAFEEGVYTYTGYVAAAKTGSYGLWQGTVTLTDANEDLRDAADELLDAMAELVQEQLAESDIYVTLTRDNFEAELDKLMVSGGQVDKKLRETLQDTKDSFHDIREFRDGVIEYTDAVQEAADGSKELVDGVEELKDAADDMLEELFAFELENLTSFTKKADNPRIMGSYNDVIISKYAGIAAGVIIMLLFTYVISVFVIHNIEQESSIIGALYALGVKRKQLIFHYLLLPVIVTVMGGIAGSLLAFTPIGIGWMMADTVVYYSFPSVPPVFPPYLMVYALVMPPVIAVLVNYVSVNKKLKCTALSLIRNEQKTSRIRDVKLGKRMGFIRRFQIRQMLRELRSAMAVIIGMYVCLIIVVLSLDCYVLCENYRVAAVEETNYEYMYTYKYPTEEAPEGGTAAYMESLRKEAYGYKMDVIILGIDENNPYYDISVSDHKNEIVVGSAVAEKYELSEGDKLILTDEVNNQDYAFTVKDVVYLESAFYCFMDIDAMRELFGQEDDYYNVVFSDHALDIDAGRLYSTVTRQSVMDACSIFVEMMMPMVILLTAVAAIIFVVVMYLMVKVMIDRSAFSIAMVKIFGFRRREIRKLYLNGNFLLVALGALLCIPLAKATMDALYPYCISNVAIGMDLHYPWQLYVGLYGAILLCYIIINPLLMRRINRMTPAEVLKNRE